ncbi:MAG: tetratricopeptide repeat protein [Gammaproteobacteria bacterium]|nr:tetratricopeptide repeat protein [Gammaproteobacteria bacterium]
MSRTRYLIAPGIAVFLTLGSGITVAHTGIDQQIMATTQLIETSPGDYHHLLKRAELYRRHGEWSKAETDIAAAVAVGPDAVTRASHYYLGRIYLDAGLPQKARAHLLLFVEQVPEHADAVLLLARSSRQLGILHEARAQYLSALGFETVISPELIVEYASILVEMGEVDLVLAFLDKENARRGRLVSIQQYAIQIALSANRFNDARRLVEDLPSAIGQQPRWLMLAGDIDYLAGHHAEALQLWKQSLIAIESLPVYRAETPALLVQRERLEVRMAGGVNARLKIAIDNSAGTGGLFISASMLTAPR